MFYRKLRVGAIAPREKIEFDRPFVLSMGPQRCATSWLDRYLRQRGDLCLPLKVKEIRYFDKHFNRGSNFYKRHFRPAANHSAIIEISTTCFDEPEAPKRVYNMLGSNTRLLCPLRHPVSRSYSLYKHYLRYGTVKGGLQYACQQNPQIITSSYYAQHIKAWLDYFPREQIKFIFQEEDQEGYLRDICQYLDITYIPTNKETKSRYNAFTGARYSILAAGMQNSAEFLRKYELYDVINAAKAAGLKDLIFGKEAPREETTPHLPAKDQLWLEQQLLGEVEKLEALLGPIPQW